MNGFKVLALGPLNLIGIKIPQGFVTGVDLDFKALLLLGTALKLFSKSVLEFILFRF